jgi:hypothetical protein
VARTRKTSDKAAPGANDDSNGAEIEDAVVVEGTDPETHEPTSDSMSEPPEPPASEAMADEPLQSPEPDAPYSETPAYTDEPAPATEEMPPPSEPQVDAAGPDAVHERAGETPPPASAPARGGAGGAIALIFGGIIAAGVGFAASRYVLPEGWPGQNREIAAELGTLREESGALAARLGTLEGAIEELRGSLAALPDTEARETALREELRAEMAAAVAAASESGAILETFEARLDELAVRVEDLALRPIPDGLDTTALDAELTQFREELSTAVEAARAEVLRAQEEAAAIAAAARDEAAAQEAAAAEEAERLRQEAEANAADLARRAAMAQVVAAVESGEPYADRLAALQGVEVPEALAASAADGVATLARLQEEFPDAARRALDASIRADIGGSAMDRFTAFVRVQTGARSLEARDGDDPDAVLSRAEANVREGDLAAALAELEALPEPGRVAMADWLVAARTRLDALRAAQSLNPN